MKANITPLALLAIVGPAAIVIALAGRNSANNTRSDEYRQDVGIQPTKPLSVRPNDKLATIYIDDRRAHSGDVTSKTSWDQLAKADSARQQTVKDMYVRGQLHTGDDYYLAASLLERSKDPTDLLLAHELAILSIANGDNRGLWMAAASQDRYLVSIGKPQRFGTQFRLNPVTKKVAQHPIQGLMTDAHRQKMNVPSLAKLHQQEPIVESVAKRRVRPGDEVQYPNT